MNTFSLQIVSPDGLCFDGEAAQLGLRTIEGDVAVMAGHVPYVTAIGMGECHLVLPDGSDRYAACCGGLLNVGASVRLIASTFEWAEEIDVTRAEAARSRAAERLEAGPTDEAHRASLEDHLRRAEVRLRVAGGVKS